MDFFRGIIVKLLLLFSSMKVTDLMVDGGSGRDLRGSWIGLQRCIVVKKTGPFPVTVTLNDLSAAIFVSIKFARLQHHT